MGGGGRGRGIKDLRNQEGFCASRMCHIEVQLLEGWGSAGAARAPSERRTDEEEEMRRENEKEEGKKKEGGEREVIQKEAKKKEVEIERRGEETREKGMGDESKGVNCPAAERVIMGV